jgi:hypothetical protein
MSESSVRPWEFLNWEALWSSVLAVIKSEMARPVMSKSKVRVTMRAAPDWGFGRRGGVN